MMVMMTRLFRNHLLGNRIGKLQLAVAAVESGGIARGRDARRKFWCYYCIMSMAAWTKNIFFAERSERIGGGVGVSLLVLLVILVEAASSVDAVVVQ
jgi:hypothetical protein